MNIAIVITGLGMGGAENQVVALADTYASLGHEVCIVALTGDLVVLPAMPSIRVIGLNMRKDPLGFAAAYLRLRSILSSFRPDVVHSHMVHANLISRLLRLTFPIKRLVCTAHSSNEGGRLRMALYRLTDWLAHVTTNVSQDGVARYIALGAASSSKIKMIPNGIDCERFRFVDSARLKARSELGVTNDSFVFLAVGRFVSEKDYPNLLQAFQRVARQLPVAQLWIAGDGDEKDNCIAFARDLGIANRVKFLGIRRDVPELMSAADAFVLSSRIEGLPLVIGEAMACERMVVATDAGGVREFVGDAGLVVPIGDAARLADALAEAANLPAVQREQRGQRSRAHIERVYSLSSVVSQWMDVYRAH